MLYAQLNWKEFGSNVILAHAGNGITLEILWKTCPSPADMYASATTVELYALTANSKFQLHKASGFLSREGSTEETDKRSKEQALLYMKEFAQFYVDGLVK